MNIKKLEYDVMDKGVFVVIEEKRKYKKIIEKHGILTEYDEDNEGYFLRFLYEEGDNIIKCLKELEGAL